LSWLFHDEVVGLTLNVRNGSKADNGSPPSDGPRQRCGGTFLALNAWSIDLKVVRPLRMHVEGHAAAPLFLPKRRFCIERQPQLAFDNIGLIRRIAFVDHEPPPIPIDLVKIEVLNRSSLAEELSIVRQAEALTTIAAAGFGGAA
jgi:hypothetical protein